MEYDPDFVAEILEADTAPAQAAFSDLAEMLNWLDQDENS